MKPSLWAEIHRLNDVEHLSQRLIAQRLACGRDTVKRALTMPQPPQQYSSKKPRGSKLDPYKKTIQELLITYPKLTGVRVEEEVRKLGYSGGKTILIDYLHDIRSKGKRVYQPVEWKSGDAMQLDWGDCKSVSIGTTAERPVDRLAEEALLPLPDPAYDTRKVCQCVVNSHAHVLFETNRYSVPPEAARRAVTLKANDKTVWIYYLDRELARHHRCYERKAMIILPAHRQAALTHRKKESDRDLSARFGDLGPIALAFSEGLRRSPCQPLTQMRKILKLCLLYSNHDVLLALEAACTYQTFQASYVENLIQQNRRRLSLPSPLPLSPIRLELLENIDLEEPDLTIYDHLIEGASCDEENSNEE